MRVGDTAPIIFWCHGGCSFEAITDELRCSGMWPVQFDPWRRLPPTEPERDAEAARKWDRIVKINSDLQLPMRTPVERYLRSRGIEPHPEWDYHLRYHPKLFHDLHGTEWPAMVAKISDVTGKAIGLHRTYLRYDRPGKAPVDPYSPKLSLGSVRGGAVQLSPAGPTLVIGEGIETTMSVMQATGLHGWAALGTTNMLNIDLPNIVKEVIIAVDGDEPGRDAARRAGYRWQRLGRRVRVMEAPAGHDWNDVLRGAVR
jgi:hypothetical protein